MPINKHILLKIHNNDPALTQLMFKHIKIDFIDANALTETLKANKNLTRIIFSGNSMNAQVAAVFFDALKHNTSLTDLEFFDNPIGDDGARALANALKVNTTLKRISLRYTSITDAGAEALADSLKVNITLTSLDISYNFVTKYPSVTAINPREILRNLHIAFVLKDSIKAAWTQPIAKHSPRSHRKALETINFIFTHTNAPGEALVNLIEAIVALRLSNDEREAELTEVVIENMKAYVSSVYLDFDRLPDSAYPNEFIRLLVARVNAKNVCDTEAQVMALEGLLEPFADSALQEDANIALIGLLSNNYFASLAEDTMQRGARDLLIIVLSCQYPNKRDMMAFALAAYARLQEEPEINCGEVFQQLDNSEAVISNFQQLLTKECEINGWTREELKAKCLEEFARESMPAPALNPHGFFQPSEARKSPVPEEMTPHRRPT